jgi:hypothetical protein
MTGKTSGRVRGSLSVRRVLHEHLSLPLYLLDLVLPLPLLTESHKTSQILD